MYFNYCANVQFFGGHVVGVNIPNGIGCSIEDTAYLRMYGTLFDDCITAIKLHGSGDGGTQCQISARVEDCTTGIDLEKGYQNTFYCMVFSGGSITTPFTQDAGASNYDNSIVWPIFPIPDANNIVDGNAGTSVKFHVLDFSGLAQRKLGFTADDATPSVNSFTDIYFTQNSNPTTITDFDDGLEGQKIRVIINDNNTTVDFTSSGLRGNGGVDWSPSKYDFMECFYDGTDWYCSVHDCSA